MKRNVVEVGLTASALLRWMVSGPEMARIIGKFRVVLDKKKTVSQLNHHEDQPGALTYQNVFFCCFCLFGVSASCPFLDQSIRVWLKPLTILMDKPFSETSSDLLVLGTRKVTAE